MIVPINRLLKDSGLAPEEIERLRQAYGYVLKSLQLVDRNDPFGEIKEDHRTRCSNRAKLNIASL